MNREILFRGKRADNGEWMEGYVFDDGLLNSDRKFVGGFVIEDYEGGADDTFRVTGSFYYEVYPETICPYTGLTDRNGRKIFEGDIVNCREKRGAAFWRCKVQWNETRAGFDVINADCAFPMCLDECGRDIPINGSDYEVVGNIFDNPELMEGGD